MVYIAGTFVLYKIIVAKYLNLHLVKKNMAQTFSISTNCTWKRFAVHHMVICLHILMSVRANSYTVKTNYQRDILPFHVKGANTKYSRIPSHVEDKFQSYNLARTLEHSSSSQQHHADLTTWLLSLLSTNKQNTHYSIWMSPRDYDYKLNSF